MSDTIYEIKNVTKKYKAKGQPVMALNDVSLAIPAGQFVTIQGKTGSGKSTLLQLLGGLDVSSSGTLHFEGNELSSLSRGKLTKLRAERIGFIFQSFNLIPTLTALENVETALVPLGVKRRERKQRATEVLESVGLGERINHYPSELSGGQQQRVAIARALVKKPDVIVADEPSAALDEDTRDEILALLEQLQKDNGMTLVVVTHDRGVAARGRQRVSLKDGRIKTVA
jgi:putative ABC transport system ATP-binding protein